MTTSNFTIKQSLFQWCTAIIEERLKTIKQHIEQIQESLSSETKSTAGDKHETGRAMLQLERENAGYQLAEITKTKTILSKIDVFVQSPKIRLGSVVFTSQANYFIAVSLGEIRVENKVFYAISPSSPIGQLLIGKCVGDTVNFRGRDINISKIL